MVGVQTGIAALEINVHLKKKKAQNRTAPMVQFCIFPKDAIPYSRDSRDTRSSMLIAALFTVHAT